MDRQEHIVDTSVQEGADIDKQKLMAILKRFDENMNEIGGYGDPDYNKILTALNQGDVESAVEEVWYSYYDQDGGEIDMDAYIEDLEAEFKDMVGGNESAQTEGAMSEIAIELAQVADDEDYDKLYDLLSDPGPVGQYLQDKIDEITGETGLHPKDDIEKIEPMLMDIVQQEFGGQNDDEGGETDDNYALASAGFGSDEDYESIQVEKAPPGAKAERMVKHIKKGYADDGKLTKKEKGIAYATAWKQHNKEKNESINTGEDMRNLREGEIQQASAIVTAKTMVDRVGRWIEELSGMENDTLLQLGDSIRDEMGQEQAKAFIEAVAPAIQQALDTLKGTRDTLSTGVRSLASGEAPADMLGGDAGGEADMGGEAEPDMMNTGGAEEMGPPEDEFAAAEPAAGGLGDAGREQRESINRSSSLLKVLAG
jgi:hypothetical protein